MDIKGEAVSYLKKKKVYIPLLIVVAVIMLIVSVANSGGEKEPSFPEPGTKPSLTTVTPTAEPTPNTDLEPTPEPEQPETVPEPEPVPTDVGTPGEPVEPLDIPASSAIAALNSLKVVDDAALNSMDDYDRDNQFPHWRDPDGDGCNGMHQTRKQQMTDITIDESKCKVTAGTLNDPYTGETLNWVSKGKVLVDIDHVVSLGDAWRKGAEDITEEQRMLLANDPINLLAVDAGENRSKGDADAADYLPENKAFHCEYVARQIAVKSKYSLWVRPAEKEVMANVLQSCPEQGASFDGVTGQMLLDGLDPLPVASQ